jgi:hypothetical protein
MLRRLAELRTDQQAVDHSRLQAGVQNSQSAHFGNHVERGAPLRHAHQLQFADANDGSAGFANRGAVLRSRLPYSARLAGLEIEPRFFISRPSSTARTAASNVCRSACREYREPRGSDAGWRCEAWSRIDLRNCLATSVVSVAPGFSYTQSAISSSPGIGAPKTRQSSTLAKVLQAAEISAVPIRTPPGFSVVSEWP